MPRLKRPRFGSAVGSSADLWPVFGRSSARGPCLQASQWHPRVAKGLSIGSSARGRRPQMPQWHPRVAKKASDRSSARRVGPQVLQRHPGVPNGSSDRSSARGPCPQASQWHPRVAKRASIGTLVRGPSTEALLGQGRVPKGRESVPLQGLRSGSRPGLARHTRLQVVLRQGRVAKGTSIGTLARGPSTEALLGQGRVPKGRESVPLTGSWSSLRPGLARHPRLQIVLRQGRVAKRASIGTLARGLLPKVLQRHPSVAKRGFRPTLRHGDPQQNHLRDGSARRRNLFSNKDY